jgi:hypothetical protein
MNGYITCETCHNSTHAEWPSTLELDNKIPIKFMANLTLLENVQPVMNKRIMEKYMDIKE